MFFFFFFNDTATTEIYTLSLHDALPIYHLIGVFWGDKPQDDARHSLNQALGTLRPYMGEGGLDSDAAQVRLNPGAVQLDVDQLEGFVAAGDHRRAAALIQGDFLEGFGIKGASEFENWLTAEGAAWKDRKS